MTAISSPERALCVVTLGCKVNQYDSEAMAEALRREGWQVVSRPDDLPGGRGIVLVNSCAVTARAAAKSRQQARAAVRRYPGAQVVLAGCYPQAYPGEAAGVAGLAATAGTGRVRTLDLLRSLVGSMPEVAGVPNLTGPAPLGEQFEMLPATPVSGRVRAFLKIEEGCSMHCAYCIVPACRGSQRSASADDAVRSAEALLRQGACELVLTGINLGAYDGGGVPGMGLPALVQRLLGLPGLRRLRLSSIEPTDISDELLAVLAASPRACRHLHVPLQSGSDSVLGRMGRQYTALEYLAVVERTRAALPGLALSTDVLAGLPGETLADVEATERLLRAAGFMRLHVFPYSPRPGTRAASLPEQVPAAEREARARHLTEVGQELALAHHRGMLGREHEVLLETEPQVAQRDAGVDAGLFGGEGLTSGYVRVLTRSSERLPAGTLVRVRVDGCDAAGAEGTVLGLF